MSSAGAYESQSRWMERQWRSVGPVTLLLWPLSLLYRGLFSIKSKLYAINSNWRYRAPRPVIVVGNLSVGGSGKTPVTIWLVNWLKHRGYKPGVILRGYKGNSTQWPLDVCATTDASTAGDEAVLISKLTRVPVVAGPDRSDDCKHLLERHDCNVVVSDDGLQHFALERDFEIVLAGDEQGNGFCLPAGPLREPLSRLNKVDLVVWSSGARADLRRVLGTARRVGSSETRPLSSFKNARIVAIAGIGRPQQFFQLLSDAGLEFDRRVFPDHHAFSVSDLDPGNCDIVLMTEKDAVKCESYSLSCHWAVQLEIELSPRVIEDLKSRLLPLLDENRN